MFPSRYSNPFATCWTKPGAIPFRFPAGMSRDQLVRQLADQGWRGEIVGPHGSGKSTLLATLAPRLRDAGRSVHAVALHDGDHRLPHGFFHDALSTTSPLVIVDGYEQLAPLRRWWLRLVCRRVGAGLLVTSHASTALPPLVRLKPDLRLVERLVAELAARAATSVSSSDVAASHACHGSNVREILFDLYDRHERTMRPVRTTTARLA